MDEPLRVRVPSRPAGKDDRPTGEAFELDLLLIADEPAASDGPQTRSVRRGIAAGRVESIEPLDMETVVRKLIALLNDENFK